MEVSGCFSRFRGKVSFVCRDFCAVDTFLEDEAEKIQVYFSSDDFCKDWAAMHLDLTIYFKLGDPVSCAETEPVTISNRSKLTKVLPFDTPSSAYSENRCLGVIEMLDRKMRCGLIWTAPKPTNISSVTKSCSFLFNYSEFKDNFEVGSKVIFTGRQLTNMQCVAENLKLYSNSNVVDNSVFTLSNAQVTVQPQCVGWQRDRSDIRPYGILSAQELSVNHCSYGPVLLRDTSIPFLPVSRHNFQSGLLNVAAFGLDPALETHEPLFAQELHLADESRPVQEPLSSEKKPFSSHDAIDLMAFDEPVFTCVNQNAVDNGSDRFCPISSPTSAIDVLSASVAFSNRQTQLLSEEVSNNRAVTNLFNGDFPCVTYFKPKCDGDVLEQQKCVAYCDDRAAFEQKSDTDSTGLDCKLPPSPCHYSASCSETGSNFVVDKDIQVICNDASFSCPCVGPVSCVTTSTASFPDFDSVDKLTGVGLVTSVFSSWGRIWTSAHGIMRFNRNMLLDCCSDADFLRFHPIQAVEFEAAPTVADINATGFQISKLWPILRLSRLSSASKPTCSLFDPDQKLQLTKARVTRITADAHGNEDLFAYSNALREHILVNWTAFSLQEQPNRLGGRVCLEDVLTLLVIRIDAHYEALAVVRNEISDVGSLWNLSAFSTRLDYDEKVMWRPRQPTGCSNQMTSSRRSFDKPFSTNSNRAVVTNDWSAATSSDSCSARTSDHLSREPVNECALLNGYGCGSGAPSSISKRSVAGRGRGKPVAQQNTVGLAQAASSSALPSSGVSPGEERTVNGVGLVTTVYNDWGWGLMWYEPYEDNLVRFSAEVLGSISQFHPVQVVEFEAFETSSEFHNATEKKLKIFKLTPLSLSFKQRFSSSEKLSLVIANVAYVNFAQYPKQYAFAHSFPDSRIYLHWTALSLQQEPFYGKVPPVGTSVKLLVIPCSEKYRTSTHYALLPVRNDVRDVSDLLERCAYSTTQDFVTSVQWTP